MLSVALIRQWGNRGFYGLGKHINYLMLETYIARFSKLRSDQSPARWGARTKHRAPHKPLLLLAVLDQFAESTVLSNLVEASLELSELFTLYWARVMPPDQHGSLALPFFHLQSDGFWYLLPRPGQADYLAAVRQIRSLSDLNKATFGARLDDDLYTLLQIEEVRATLRRVLIETYFVPEAHSALLGQSRVNQEAYQYGETLLKQAKENLAREGLLKRAEYEPAVRDQGFRRAVMSAYCHHCAFCGIKVLTPDGHTAADAAHIIPWSRTQNDAIDNGLSLCKLCHWGFDEGLLTASAQSTVLVSALVKANYNVPAHLPALDGRLLTLPAKEYLWPSKDGIEWHRRKIYRSR